MYKVKKIAVLVDMHQLSAGYRYYWQIVTENGMGGERLADGKHDYSTKQAAYRRCRALNATLAQQ